MIYAIDSTATLEYSLQEDKGEERTVFLIAVVDPITRAHIEDLYLKWSINRGAGADGPATASFDKNKLDLDIVRFGLRGWRNFRKRDGSEVEFKTVSKGIQGLGPRSVISDECLRLFAPEWISELADAIRKAQRLDAEQEKN